jgi:hypothetical protein
MREWQVLLQGELLRLSIYALGSLICLFSVNFPMILYSDKVHKNPLDLNNH